MLFTSDSNRHNEKYHYASMGVRTSKCCYQPLKTDLRQQSVRYSQGLEIRTSHRYARETERLLVINLNGTRILCWQTGKPDGLMRYQIRYSRYDQTGSNTLELDDGANVISREVCYPFGGTALWATRNQVEACYKAIRYSGKERDASGLYAYGYRYYAPWMMRWLNPDPAGSVDGLNHFRMVGNSPLTFHDKDGRVLSKATAEDNEFWQKSLAVTEEDSDVISDDIFFSQIKISKDEKNKGLTLSSEEKDLLKSYTHGGVFNEYLRADDNSEGRKKMLFDSGIIDQIETLKTAINKLPASNPDQPLFRGEHGERSTSGIGFRNKRVKAGDFLTNSEFTSFTGNPTVAINYSTDTTSKFDDTAVVYKINHHPNAKIIAPYSVFRHEAESIYSPGHFFLIQSVDELTLSTGGPEPQHIVQVTLSETEKTDGMAKVYDLKTAVLVDPCKDKKIV